MDDIYYLSCSVEKPGTQYRVKSCIHSIYHNLEFYRYTGEDRGKTYDLVKLSHIDSYLMFLNTDKIFRNAVSNIIKKEPDTIPYYNSICRVEIATDMKIIIAEVYDLAYVATYEVLKLDLRQDTIANIFYSSVCPLIDIHYLRASMDYIKSGLRYLNPKKKDIYFEPVSYGVRVDPRALTNNMINYFEQIDFFPKFFYDKNICSYIQNNVFCWILNNKNTTYREFYNDFIIQCLSNPLIFCDKTYLFNLLVMTQTKLKFGRENFDKLIDFIKHKKNYHYFLGLNISTDGIYDHLFNYCNYETQDFTETIKIMDGLGVNKFGFMQRCIQKLIKINSGIKKDDNGTKRKSYYTLYSRIGSVLCFLIRNRIYDNNVISGFLPTIVNLKLFNCVSILINHNDEILLCKIYQEKLQTHLNYLPMIMSQSNISVLGQVIQSNKIDISMIFDLIIGEYRITLNTQYEKYLLELMLHLINTGMIQRPEQILNKFRKFRNEQMVDLICERYNYFYL